MTRSLWVRLMVGAAVTLLATGLLAAVVDVGGALSVLGTMSLAPISVAAAFVISEVWGRAFRWHLILVPHAPVPLTGSLAFLTIGHLGNAVLPMRLGDVLRAGLVSRRFPISPVTAMGTIVLERVCDGGLLLLVVVVAFTMGMHDVGPIMWSAAIVVVVFAGVTAAALLTVLPPRLRDLRHRLTRSLARGGSVLRSPSSAAAIAVVTVLSLTQATLILHFVGVSFGEELGLGPSLIVMAGMTLSTAVPAGPASLGTYELAGTTLLVSIGISPESALAITVVTHFLVAVPVAIVGAVSWGFLHLAVKPSG